MAGESNARRRVRLLQLYDWTIALGILVVVGFGGVTWYGYHNIGVSGVVGALLAGGCCLLGGLGGFLFAIPRVKAAGEGWEDAVSASPRRPTIDPNTNLEQISDWL